MADAEPRPGAGPSPAPDPGAVARLRAGTLAALAAEPFDALIIGAGCVGAGTALHAASLGLRVALVDRGDLAGGTSSRSTKLIHGGVRYLERAVRRADPAEFALVREGLRERAAFFRAAPHLSRRVALLTPTRGRWSQLYYEAGLRLYDLLSGPASLGPTEALGAAAALARLPALEPRGLHGAVLYYDGQFDDARMAVLLALTARRAGAAVANYAGARALLYEGGRVAGALVRDGIGGGEFAVRARTVINAAGPFADGVRGLEARGALPGGPPGIPAEPLVSVSSGVHVVVRGDLCPDDTGLVVPRTPDGRVVFVLPWMGRTLLGTTDRPAEPEARPQAAARDVDYLLEQAGRYLSAPLGRGDVRSAWSGLRPLVRDLRRRGRGTAELARSHVVVQGPPGLITVVGGKWTTYRRIAADTVGALRGRAGPEPDLPVLGAQGWSEAAAVAVGRGRGLPEDVARHLGHAYGTEAPGVCALLGEGGAAGAARLAEGLPYIEAEVRWAVRAELARTPVDVLARRTRLAFLDRAAALACLPRTAGLMAEELGWDARERTAQEAAAREEIAASF